ncbi:MAG: hypothetical protein H6717_11990 [Polyangiaceae bacterium]|nr:hypothetical protein [Polyangiaceae bacterium]
MQIRRLFASGPPNGWLLGWDRDRGFDDLSALVAPLAATNNTSFDYAFCNHFEVRLSLAEERYAVLTVLTSFVADVFSVHWTVYDPGGQAGRVVGQPPEGKRIEADVRAWLGRRGLRELPDELLRQPIPGIELELSGADDVTLGKCLFRDSAG